MYKYLKDKFLEDKYIISDEYKNSTLFGIGNGYFGIRGSFEEFGDVFLQGTYVRGVFDQIIEIPQTISDNSYMKKYYFDEEALKDFEYEDSCINIGDITSFRIIIDGKVLKLWNYNILSYERYIDFKNGGLVRKVIIEDENKNQTLLEFFKVCSFSNDHIFLQTLNIKKLNHNLDIIVQSGIDLRCKTNGQKKILNPRVFLDKNDKNIIRIHANYGHKYNMHGDYGFKNETHNFTKIDNIEYPKPSIYQSYKLDKQEGEIKKIVSFYANIDKKKPNISISKDLTHSYEKLYKNHIKKYNLEFKKVDIKVSGNDELDTLLRYANYQTLIGINRNDYIHSLSAKNLTAEKYNQFVWWDCEIYQMPFVLLSNPKIARNLLMYRYNRMKESKNNALKNGYKGAKYAFCSSVKGDEQVWIYARHPFLQIHINSDIAYAILNYYKHTLDEQFLLKYGFYMIEEIILYFISRSTYENNQYHLKCVTGTDEHHDYVNNDAYTNLTLKYVVDEFIRLIKKFNYDLKELNYGDLIDFSTKLYVPKFNERILPQFDGYLSLNKDLVIEGNSTSKASSFQMKESGLYHLSQVIKQPDVLLLYSYLNIGLKENYLDNYKYYLKRCEASSSLTYCVHALCGIDNDDLEEFYKDLITSLKIDIDDIHNNAHQGVHAGSLASGYYLFIRGILGVKINEDYLEINPHKFKKIKGFKLNFVYHNNVIGVNYSNKRITFKSKEDFEYKLFNDSTIRKTNNLEIKF